MNLEDAKEQMLHKIELQLCYIYEAGSDAPTKLQEFYDYVEGLTITHLLFQWYRMNDGNINIKFNDGKVRIKKLTDSKIDVFSENMERYDGIHDIIWDALENRN